MSNNPRDFSFYGADHPDNVLSAYLESHRNLYDQTRYQATAEFISRHVQLSRMQVLEVGCGGGMWSSFFADKVRALTCIDIRHHVVEAAKLHVARNHSVVVGSKIRWFAGDVADYPSDDRFDLVFLKDVIEHVVDDAKFLREIALRVNINGYVYIATQNAWSLNRIIEGFYQQVALRNRGWCGWDPTHVRFYSPRTLKNLAQSAGFRTLAWHGMYHLPYRFVSRLLFKRVIEHRALHAVELNMGETWPFSLTGWAIGVLLQKLS